MARLDESGSMQLQLALRSIARRHQRPAVAALLVLALLCASIGLPTWVEPIKDLSQAFPCMHHRCGCASAEACWRNCCCLSAAEKLAWAEENGVKPPDYVVVAAKAPSECGGSCCQKSAPSKKVNAADVDEDATATWQFAIGSQVRHCQGLSALWVVLGQALPPISPLDSSFFKPAASAWLQVASRPTVQSPAILPAEPPPWYLAASA